MTVKRITTIVPVEILPTLERCLRAQAVPGVTVEQVKGYGEHPNYFRRDLMHDNARVILYASNDRIDTIVDAIKQAAQDCSVQSGILAVETIDRVVSLTDGAELSSSTMT